MITTKEYLELYRKYPFDEHYEGVERDKEAIIEYNKALIERYPFLLPRNRWTDDADEDFDYSYTELDMGLQEGWRIAFGNQLCEELREELIRFNYLNDFRIMEMKEKYGTLRIYCNSVPIGKLSDDYIPIDIKWNEADPKYDSKTEYLKEIGRDNYYKPKNMSEYGTDEYEEKNKDCIIHYGIYKILDKCRIYDIIDKYEKLSEKTCIDCGASTVKWESKGWINYVCDDCAKKRLNRFNEGLKDKRTIEDLFYPIEEDK